MSLSFIDCVSHGIHFDSAQCDISVVTLSGVEVFVMKGTSLTYCF